MKFSVNWLREFVDLPPSVDALAELLTLAGVEIEGTERRGANIDKVVVAQINASTQHPNADRLTVCEVDDGSGIKRQIVCGATNYKVGDKVPLALPGVTLPNGLQIQKSKLRGVESEGMLCSAKELGLGEDASGLLILPPDAKIGASGTHSLAQNSLRHEFQSHFLRREPFLKIVGMRSGERSNHMFDLIVLEHQPKLAFARPAIVADGGDVLRPFPRQRLNQVIRKACASEPSEHDLRAVGNIRHGLVETRIKFLLHGALIAPARMFGRNLASTPLARSQRPVSVPLKWCSSRARKSASSSTSISSRALRRTITRA